MSKIKNFLDDQFAREKAVITLSEKIRSKIPAINLPSGFFYETGKYAVRLENRLLAFQWHYILEICLADGSMPWSPYRGTKTASLPPQEVQDEFFQEFKEHL